VAGETVTGAIGQRQVLGANRRQRQVLSGKILVQKFTELQAGAVPVYWSFNEMPKAGFSAKCANPSPGKAELNWHKKWHLALALFSELK
jgi:hypothetical protein